MIYSILLFFHVLISIALTIAILMQSSKGGGLSGVLGGGGGLGSVFGGRGVATFLSKFTIVVAGLFLLICLILGKITHDSGNPRTESAVQRARTSRVIPMQAQPAETDAAETETPASNPEGGN